MGKVLIFKVTKHIYLKRQAEAERLEAIRLYQITAGFTDPDVPNLMDETVRLLWEMGLIEF